MKLGWLTLGHSPSPQEDFAAINEQMEQACLAERLGFDSVWLTEHNFTGESVYSDPIPFANLFDKYGIENRSTVDILPDECSVVEGWALQTLFPWLSMDRVNNNQSMIG